MDNFDNYETKKELKSDEYLPIKWNKYFDNKQYVTCRNNSRFAVYTSGTNGPLLVLLHGAGFCGLTWALFVKNLLKLIQVRILAIDLRCHGDSVQGHEYKMDIKTLTGDCEEILDSLNENESNKYLIGHSLGGCIASNMENSLKNVIGLIMIDVVEGTAKMSLNLMQSIIELRPQKFSNLTKALRYIHNSRITTNKESVRISGPGQLKYIMENNVVNDVDQFYENDCHNRKVTWRVDLAKTSPYWDDWFDGLSSKFLKAKCPKMLILTNDGRLDKDLLIGQMSGSYQFEIIRDSGHCIQEDCPTKLAEIVSRFIHRNYIEQVQHTRSQI